MYSDDTKLYADTDEYLKSLLWIVQMFNRHIYIEFGLDKYKRPPRVAALDTSGYIISGFQYDYFLNALYYAIRLEWIEQFVAYML